MFEERLKRALFCILAAAVVLLAMAPAAFAESPASPDDEDSAQTSPVVRSDASQGIRKERWLVGGLVGTFVGFGIGHAVIGEYGSTGWLFTVGEVAALSVMIYGIVLMFSDAQVDEPRDLGRLQTRGLYMMMGGNLALLALRVGEIIDVWLRPEVRDEPLFRRAGARAVGGSPDYDPGMGVGFTIKW